MSRPACDGCGLSVTDRFYRDNGVAFTGTTRIGDYLVICETCMTLVKLGMHPKLHEPTSEEPAG